MFDFIFKRSRKIGEGSDDGNMHISILENGCHLSIPSLSFNGLFVCSDNKKFKLAWRNTSNLCPQHNHDDNGLVNYILIEDSKVIAKGHIESPCKGKVSNNGTFMLHDNRCLNELNGTLYVFDVSGKEIICREFKANLITSDLSADGRFAVCQTANSDDINDSGALTVFDLTKGVELAQWHAESGWPSFYKFYPDDVIGLGDSHLGEFRYSLTGHFIDRELWQDACLFKGQYWNALIMVERLIGEAQGKPSLVLSEKLLLSMDKIMTTIPQNNEGGWQATCLKLRGKCLESKGDLKHALLCYNKALALDPKIGVKQRANKIKKMIDV